MPLLPRLRASAHSHFWIIGVLGGLAGLALLVLAPRLRGISTSLLLFAGFHLIGAFVLLASVYVTWIRRWARPRSGDGPGWLDGTLIAAVIAFAAAIALQTTAPLFWPLAFGLVAFGVLFLIGQQVSAGFRRPDVAPLPLVDLLDRTDGEVLDIGCGAGRTTLALGHAYPSARVVGLDDTAARNPASPDRFARQVELAGLQDRITRVEGGLSPLPFEDGRFDAATCTQVLDNRGDPAVVLSEALRVLKPGGRLLMTVRVPGAAMFAALNVLSFALRRPSLWRAICAGAGFQVLGEGRINGAWYVLLERPAA